FALCDSQPKPRHAVPDSPRQGTAYPRRATPDPSWAKISPTPPPLLQATQDCRDSKSKMPDPSPRRFEHCDLGFSPRAEAPPQSTLCTSGPVPRLDPDQLFLPLPLQANRRVRLSPVPSPSRARDG